MDVKFSSRIGKIRTSKKFPVYHARPEHASGHCGHQHEKLEAAINCADNQAHRTGSNQIVYRVLKKDGSETRVSRIVVALTEKGWVTGIERS